MSERDSVHKEIEKLQEEIKEKNKKLASHEGRNKHYDDEVNKQLGYSGPENLKKSRQRTHEIK